MPKNELPAGCYGLFTNTPMYGTFKDWMVAPTTFIYQITRQIYGCEPKICPE